MREQLQQRSVIESYPRRVVDQLKQVYSRANLPLINGDGEGVIMKASDMFSNTPVYPYKKDDVSQVQDMTQYDVRLLQAVEGLLVPTVEKGERYFSGIGAHDFGNLPRIADVLASDEKEVQPVVMRIVFGGTEEMQLRGLSMLIPSLQQLEKLGQNPSERIDAPTLPQLQVIFANNIASHVRGLSYTRIAAETRQFIDVSEAYIDKFFPSVGDSVLFMEDAPIVEGSFIKEEMERLVGVARGNLPEELKDRIRSKKSADDQDSSLMYAAAHLLMHDTNNSELIRPVSTNRSNAFIPGAIVSIGGRQERDFYAVRFALKDYAGDEYQIPTVQLFTKHKVPPYDRAEKGDISLSAVFRNGIDPRSVRQVDPLAGNDLSYLYAVSDRRGSMDEFIQEYRERGV